MDVRSIEFVMGLELSMCSRSMHISLCRFSLYFKVQPPTFFATHFGIVTNKNCCISPSCIYPMLRTEDKIATEKNLLQIITEMIVLLFLDKLFRVPDLTFYQ